MILEKRRGGGQGKWQNLKRENSKVIIQDIFIKPIDKIV